MSEISQERKKYLIDKWGAILDNCTTSLSGAKCMLIKSQEKYIFRKDGKLFSSFEDREKYDTEYYDS